MVIVEYNTIVSSYVDAYNNTTVPVLDLLLLLLHGKI